MARQASLPSSRAMHDALQWRNSLSRDQLDQRARGTWLLTGDAPGRNADPSPTNLVFGDQPGVQQLPLAGQDGIGDRGDVAVELLECETCFQVQIA